MLFALYLMANHTAKIPVKQSFQNKLWFPHTGFVESCPEPSSEGDLQLQIKVENEITAVDCGQQWLNEAQQAKSTKNTTEEKNAPKEEKGFAVMSDEDVRDLLEQEENKNTAMKTRVDINWLQDYMQSRLLEHRPLHTIPPSQLNDILATFFLDVRKREGYCPVLKDIFKKAATSAAY